MLPNASSEFRASGMVPSHIVFHNETFASLGMTHDITAPLWSGILAGSLLVCLFCTLIVVSCSGCAQKRKMQPAYEGLPLIKVKTTRR